MKFYHFNKKNWKFDPNLKYPEINEYILALQGYDKPVGLWLSVGKKWQKWTTEENLNIEKYKNAYEFKIDLTHVLVLNSIPKIHKFEKEYMIDEGKYSTIDWKKVKKD